MLEAFAGLGLFLFGIYLFEDLLKKLSSKSFKKIINKLTGSKIKAFFSSVFFTAVFQSSSFVTLIIFFQKKLCFRLQNLLYLIKV
jgi:phosphate:Na+ symporter